MWLILMNVIIKQADKGGGIVIQDKDNYHKKAYCLLMGQNTYTKLTEDPLPEYQKFHNSLVEDAFRDRELDKKEKLFLLPKISRTLYFYLPKVHKAPEHPHRRPIVASTNSFTSNLSQYIDFFLQPIVSNLPAFIMDSNHVLESLHHYQWEDGYLWASLDVCSLYTSVPHTVGIRALQYFLYIINSLRILEKPQFLVDGTKFYLQHNYFTFHNQFYLKLQGAALGANFTACYANVTKGYWEELHIWNHSPFAKHIVYYGRYIDVVLLFWRGDVKQFLAFVTHCNNNKLGLHFTCY